MRENQHVVPKRKDWAVKGEGNKKVTKIETTQKKQMKRPRK